ncbi:DsbA family oxidoreductase [Bradyrhizobium centrolobii]|nr:DsbA family protein [Bradyrhizobium centrolobii]
MNENRAVIEPNRSWTMEPDSRRQIVHWYDFICPFCYVSQDRDDFLIAQERDVVDLPFRAHPDIPPEGVQVGPRHGPTFRSVEAQARAAGLALNWPSRLPNSGMALGAAEWVRRNHPAVSRAFSKALFEAHFVLGEDLGDRATILRKAIQFGLNVAALYTVLEDGSALGWVRESEAMAHTHGVRGTPTWLYRGRLLTGARPIEEFSRFLQDAETP